MRALSTPISVASQMARAPILYAQENRRLRLPDIQTISVIAARGYSKQLTSIANKFTGLQLGSGVSCPHAAWPLVLSYHNVSFGLHFCLCSSSREETLLFIQRLVTSLPPEYLIRLLVTFRAESPA
jgi:hypothetical protein